MSQKETVMGQINELKDFTRGQLDAALMKIGHDAGMGTAEGINAFLRGDLAVVAPARSWREENGVIYFSVTSDGATGEEWIERLADKGFNLGDYAKRVLRHADFQPTSGMTTEVAVLKGMFFEDNQRLTKYIRAMATDRKLEKPNAEIACLIREKFTDNDIESMGLWWIVAMHEPVDTVSYPRLLGAGRSDGVRGLDAFCDGPGSRWDRVDGFAFALSQVSTQTLDT
jgi:hypothetical protein